MASFKDLLKKATGYFNPTKSGTDGFWGSKAAQTLAKAQRFIESPKSFKVLPTATVRPTDKFIPKAAKTLYNLPADIVNSIVGKGVLNVASDVGQSVGRTIGGRELPQYQDLKSSPAKIGYQVSGKLNPSRIKDLNIPMTAQETIANIAGAAEAPINAYTGGKTFGIGKNAVAHATEKTFASLLKKIPRLALEGAKMGGTAGLLSGLDQGRDAENIVEQFKQGGKTAAQGAVAGAVLSPLASVAGYGINKMLPGKMKVKATPEEPVDMVTYASDISTKDIPKEVIAKANGMKSILKKIDKGEEAIRRGGWGKNKFSPEEIDGIRRAVDEYKAQIGVKPRAPLGKLPANTSTANLPKMQEKAGILSQEHEAAQMDAEQAKIMRSMFSKDGIKDIAQLKLLGSKLLANGGDMESVRAKYPSLVERVTQAVREAEPTIQGDEEAFRYALELPVKAETVVSRPTELTALKKTITPIEKLKQEGLDVMTGPDGKPVAVSAEPTTKTMKDILGKGQKAQAKADEYDYAAWKKAVFASEQAKGGITNPMDRLTKAVKNETNAGASGLDFADEWKGKSRLSFARETMTRNFEDVMGKDAPAMKTKYLEPIAKKEAERIRWLNKERADVKDLGIAPRSADSQLVQQFGEGKITEVELRTMTKNPEKVIKAANVLRQKYDTYIKQLNVVLERNGYDPVPFRKDYFHHFNDILTSFEVAGPFHKINQALKVDELPTDINGLTADFKPGRQFFNAVLQRKDDVATPDAIQGIDKYLDGASNQIFHTDNIKRLRSLEEEIRKKYAGEEHLTNFAADLGEFTNTLAGKKPMFDRGAESWFGRKAYTIATAVKSQVGANMVGANVSSALTNYIPLTQTLATTDKQAVLQAVADTLKNTISDDGFMNKSDFLTRRVGSDPLTMTKWEKLGKSAGWLFQVVDKFTSQVVTRSKYLEAIKQGLPEAEAMRKANDWASRLMADRSKGAMPTMFNSKTMGLLTQFQLEVNNQLSFALKDIPRNTKNWQQAASQIGQLALYGYLYNNLYESITGRRPALDPIGITQDAVEDYTNPNMKKGKATANLVENVANQLPFTSVLTGGRIPIAAGIPNPISVVKGESTWGKEATKLAYLLPPFGGGQVKKSIEGIMAYDKGASIAPGGGVRFPIPKTMTNMLKTGLFGQWSTPEAQEYFREGRTPLGENQTEKYKKLQSVDPAMAETYYNNTIAIRQAKSEAKAAKEEIMKPKKTWFQNMFAKQAGAAPETSTDPLDQLVLAEKDRQTKRSLINDVQYGDEYQGLSAEQKQQIFDQEGVSESDLEEAKLYNMRSLSPANRAKLIMDDGNLDLNQLYKNDVLTPEVAKELERKGYIASADDLIEKMKLTDPYYIRKAQVKSMEKMLKTKADTQKKLIKANYQAMSKMLTTASKPRRKSSLRKTMKIQKISQPQLPKATAYKVKPL